MRDDPDAEVHRWQWVDVSKGLPDHIKKDLHVPIHQNVLRSALGHNNDEGETMGMRQPKDKSALHKYMKRRGMDPEGLLGKEPNEDEEYESPYEHELEGQIREPASEHGHMEREGEHDQEEGRKRGRSGSRHSGGF